MSRPICDNCHERTAIACEETSAGMLAFCHEHVSTYVRLAYVRLTQAIATSKRERRSVKVDGDTRENRSVTSDVHAVARFCAAHHPRGVDLHTMPDGTVALCGDDWTVYLPTIPPTATHDNGRNVRDLGPLSDMFD